MVKVQRNLSVLPQEDCTGLMPRQIEGACHITTDWINQAHYFATIWGFNAFASHVSIRPQPRTLTPSYINCRPTRNESNRIESNGIELNGTAWKGMFNVYV